MDLAGSIFYGFYLPSQSVKAKIIPWCLLFLINTCHAFSAMATPSLAQLATDSQWLKLLHYSSGEKHKSYITSQDFFLSDSGHYDALAELKATISAFYLPIRDALSPNEHAQCRFPARLIWIRKNLDLASYGEMKRLDCKQYNDWRQQVSAKSVSVIFASGYMDNPASMYGHLFLKLNSEAPRKSDLLNLSLNYGAIVPHKENPVAYIVRGIFGGYDAGFSDQEFYRHHHNYGDVELRDMWEYRLSISDKDMDFLLAHIWEVLGNKFDYYFIDENCGFHIAKLLELVSDTQIISDSSLWVIPSSVAKGLKNTQYKNAPLVSQTNFIPSKETQLHQAYSKLSSRQKSAAQNIVNNNFDIDSNEYESLASQDKKAVTESLLQYLAVLIKKQPGNNSLKDKKRTLLFERLRLPAGKVKVNSHQNEAPHLGMKPSKFSLGYLNGDNGQNFITTGFRMTYFDDLSFNSTKKRFTNLEMLDIEAIANENTLKILKLDLIDVDSLYIPTLPWDKKPASAWSVRLGFEQLHNNCFDCGIYFAEGDIGKSALFGTTNLAYAMVGAKVFAGEKDDATISAKLGLINLFHEKMSAKIEVQQAARFDLTNSYKTQYSAELNIQLATNSEIRLYMEKQETTLLGLRFNWFWGF